MRDELQISDKKCEKLKDKMIGGYFDSISIEDINLVLSHIVDPDSTPYKLLEKIFDAAAKSGKSAEKKLQEGKSIQTKIDGVIPGFIPNDISSIKVICML